MSDDLIVMAVVGSFIFASALWAGRHYRYAQAALEQSIELRSFAVKQLEDVEATFRRYPTLAKLEKLAFGDLENLLEGGDDTVWQWAALGLAMLAADKLPDETSPVLELVNSRLDHLIGDASTDALITTYHMTMDALRYPCGEDQPPRHMTPLECAAVNACGINGREAFVLALKHLTAHFNSLEPTDGEASAPLEEVAA